MYRFREMRLSKGITQKELADRLNCTNSLICMYESGKREPDLKTIITMAEIYDCSVDYLLGRTEEKALNWPKTPPVPVKVEVIEDLKPVLTTSKAPSLKKYRMSMMGELLKPTIMDGSQTIKAEQTPKVPSEYISVGKSNREQVAFNAALKALQEYDARENGPIYKGRKSPSGTVKRNGGKHD